MFIDSVTPFLYVLVSICWGGALIFRKEKYFYFCKHCNYKISGSEILKKRESQSSIYDITETEEKR